MGPNPLVPRVSGAERTDQNQPDDRKWAHSTRAAGAPGEPNRKIRAGGHAGVWVGTGDPGSLSQMLRWHLGDRRTKCCSALRSTESQNRREKGAGLSLLTPPRTLHRALCPGGWPLRTESLRVLGFQLPSAQWGHTRPRSEGGRREGLLQ